MDQLSLQEACLLELLRQNSEAQPASEPLAIVEQLRAMRHKLEEVEGIEAEDFMIRPYTARERQRLVVLAQDSIR